MGQESALGSLMRLQAVAGVPLKAQWQKDLLPGLLTGCSQESVLSGLLDKVLHFLSGVGQKLFSVPCHMELLNTANLLYQSQQV